MAKPASVPLSTDAPGHIAEPPSESPRRSPLEACHRALGAKLVEFGGWLMPLSYPLGTIAEHMACRTDAVAFDVSHLGTVRVAGRGAFERLQGQLSNDLRKIAPGRAQYTHLLDEDGSVLDDIILWWLNEDTFDVMPNASNTARVREALGGEDTTATRAVVAVQGPHARRRLSSVAPAAAEVARMHVATFVWEGVACTAAGSGYTGEDGVECAVPVSAAAGFWEAVLDAGVAPAGLGARDTLRLEAGFPLHGHELGPGITPLQAGLDWVVGWAKGEFRGRAALEKERAAGPRRLLHGLATEGRQPPRAGDTVRRHEMDLGAVTSGNFSPVLGHGIALALLDNPTEPPGPDLSVDVRGRTVAAHIVPLPFVPGGSVAAPWGGEAE